MCLGIEWFEQRDERRAERDRHGVSLRDAEAALRWYHTTIDPVATEMGEWILENWPASKLARLSQPSREILALIAEEREKRRNEQMELELEEAY